MNPKISVIMAAYNAEETINEAIESILNQSYTDWEFIICDDCSFDSTWNIINYYYEEYPNKFVVFRNEKNMRLAYSLNECLKRCNGEFVARMDADDISLPDRFNLQVNYLLENIEINLVGTEIIEFNDSSSLHVKIEDNPSPETLVKKATFFHPTIMTYKFVYDNLGGYVVKKRTSVGQDYDLWFRFFAAGYEGRNINLPLYLYRNNYRSHKENKLKVIFKYFLYELKIIETKFIGIHNLRLSKKKYFYVLLIHSYTFLKFIINNLFIGKKYG